jgi:hypothetical protein
MGGVTLVGALLSVVCALLPGVAHAAVDSLLFFGDFNMESVGASFLEV